MSKIKFYVVGSGDGVHVGSNFKTIAYSVVSDQLTSDLNNTETFCEDWDVLTTEQQDEILDCERRSKGWDRYMADHGITYTNGSHLGLEEINEDDDRYEFIFIKDE